MAAKKLICNFKHNYINIKEALQNKGYALRAATNFVTFIYADPLHFIKSTLTSCCQNICSVTAVPTEQLNSKVIPLGISPNLKPPSRFPELAKRLFGRI